MPEKLNILFVGVAMVVGFGLEQLGGASMIIAAISVFAMGCAIVFVWFRVGQLAKETAHLSQGVDKLNDKVQTLEQTMTDSVVNGG